MEFDSYTPPVGNDGPNLDWHGEKSPPLAPEVPLSKNANDVMTAAIARHATFEKLQREDLDTPQSCKKEDEDYLRQLPHILADIEHGKLKRDLRRSGATSLAAKVGWEPVRSPVNKQEQSPFASPNGSRRAAFAPSSPRNMAGSSLRGIATTQMREPPVLAIPQQRKKKRQGMGEEDASPRRTHRGPGGGQASTQTTFKKGDAKKLGSPLSSKSRKLTKEERSSSRKGTSGADSTAVRIIVDKKKRADYHSSDEGDSSSDDENDSMPNSFLFGKKPSRKKKSKRKEKKERNAFYQKLLSATRDIKTLIQPIIDEEEAAEKARSPLGFSLSLGDGDENYEEEEDEDKPKEQTEVEFLKEQVSNMFTLIENSEKDGVLVEIFDARHDEEADERKLKMMEYRAEEEKNELELMTEQVDDGFRTKERAIKRKLTRFYGVIQKLGRKLEGAGGVSGSNRRDASARSPSAKPSDEVLQLQLKVAMLNSKLKEVRTQLNGADAINDDDLAMDAGSGSTSFIKIIDNQQDQIYDLKQSVENLTKHVEDGRQKCSHLEAQLHIATSKESKDSKMKQYQDTIATLRAEIDELKAGHADASSTSALKSQQVEVLHERYGQRMEEEREHHSLEIKRVKSECERKVLNLKRKVGDLEIRLRNAGEEVPQETNEPDGNESGIQMAEIVLSISLKNKVAVLSAQNVQLRNMYTKVKSKLTTLRKNRTEEKKKKKRMIASGTSKPTSRSSGKRQGRRSSVSPLESADETRAELGEQDSSTLASDAIHCQRSSPSLDSDDDISSDEELPEEVSDEKDVTPAGENIEEMCERMVKERDTELTQQVRMFSFSFLVPLFSFRCTCVCVCVSMLCVVDVEDLFSITSNSILYLLNVFLFY